MNRGILQHNILSDEIYLSFAYLINDYDITYKDVDFSDNIC